MNRRPPPAVSPRSGPRVTIVTRHWGELHDERQVVMRQVAGALSRRARVSVIHLTEEDSPRGSRRDGAFEVERLPVGSGRPFIRAVMIASLRASISARGLPGLTDAYLKAVEGAGSDELVSSVARSEPDVLVIGGVVPNPARGWAAALGRATRIAVLPLSGDDPLLELPGYRDCLGHADVVCTLGAAERCRVSRLRASARAPATASLSPVFAVDQTAAGFGLRGLSGVEGYVVFLRGFPLGPVEDADRPDFEGLEQLVPGLAVADVSRGGWSILADGSEDAVPTPASRPNLWRLMSHALATVDLRPAGLLHRELIESLLLGTPVAVPAASRSKELIEQSGGGIVFADEAELVTALRTFADREARARLSDLGRRWAQEHHGDQERFTGSIVRVVLGLPYP